MEHFCGEHNTAFKRHTKEGKEWYSHQIEGGGWCKETEGDKPAKVEKGVAGKSSSNEMTKEDWAEKDRLRDAIISLQNCYTGVPAVVELYKKYPDDPLAQATYNYAMNRMGNWASQGEPRLSPEATESDSSPTEEKTGVLAPTTEQRKRLSAALKGWDTSLAQAMLIRKFAANDTKMLSRLQMENFICELENPDPADVPF